MLYQMEKYTSIKNTIIYVLIIVIGAGIIVASFFLSSKYLIVKTMQIEKEQLIIEEETNKQSINLGNKRVISEHYHLGILMLRKILNQFIFYKKKWLI